MRDPGFLDAVRSSYDHVAAHYATLFNDELADEPMLRSVLTLFADLVTAPGTALAADPADGYGLGPAGPGRVADVGCGPGHVTAFLRNRGLDVFGVDLSPGMIAQARAGYPDLDFEVGSMTALNHPDAGLSGLNAFYSTIHFPTPELPAVYREFHRVLRPGAPLLLAFQAGDEPKHFTHAWDHDVDLTIHRRRPETVTGLLAEAGFRTVMTSLYEPPSKPGRQYAYVIAHRLPS
ncbi:class I SAM-dependent DNA methyltransferase [Actinoplanes xinjiangensis]|uniref:class I SAM-dependent DNA methyltransferase n=1 Tax=Actinoplanes xinjiangensis TaxID=512350 RepID=UPI000D6AE64E|nr:class I SAM-dependent methyltransferase [Actinoplanes xinjiangensis]GIF38459.1 methyltransferase [Actinoplanes xinjiangensis]